MTAGREATRCGCGRRILAAHNGPFCVRCMKHPDACKCDDLTIDPEGWGEVGFFPRGRYRVVEQESGWSVETQDDGSFS